MNATESCQCHLIVMHGEDGGNGRYARYATLHQPTVADFCCCSSVVQAQQRWGWRKEEASVCSVRSYISTAIVDIALHPPPGLATRKKITKKLVIGTPLDVPFFSCLCFPPVWFLLLFLHVVLVQSVYLLFWSRDQYSLALENIVCLLRGALLESLWNIKEVTLHCCFKARCTSTPAMECTPQSAPNVEGRCNQSEQGKILLLCRPCLWCTAVTDVLLSAPTVPIRRATPQLLLRPPPETSSSQRREPHGHATRVLPWQCPQPD